MEDVVEEIKIDKLRNIHNDLLYQTGFRLVPGFHEMKKQVDVDVGKVLLDVVVLVHRLNDWNISFQDLGIEII